MCSPGNALITSVRPWIFIHAGLITAEKTAAGVCILTKIPVVSEHIRKEAFFFGPSSQNESFLMPYNNVRTKLTQIYACPKFSFNQYIQTNIFQ